MTQNANTEAPARVRQLSFDEADAALDGALSIFEGSYDTVLLYQGDVSVSGNFLQAIGKPARTVDLIVVDGNLTVDGDITLFETTPGLLVTGLTVADTLQGGDAEVYIGDGTIKYFVYGHYNDGIL